MVKTINVIATTACLGGAVTNLFTNVNIILHCQKNRVDYILDVSEDLSKKAQADKILPLHSILNFPFCSISEHHKINFQ